jgi:hypothetical protein
MIELTESGSTGDKDTASGTQDNYDSGTEPHQRLLDAWIFLGLRFVLGIGFQALTYLL